jgi:alkylation response protein AidB-like acyl-CoA dehydrogenase
MRIEAARYLTWKACHSLETGDQELGRRWMTGAVPRRRSIETKVYCSELAVQVVYDAMRIVGAESDTKRTPLERLVRVAKTGVPRELAG